MLDFKLKFIFSDLFIDIVNGLTRQEKNQNIISICLSKTICAIIGYLTNHKSNVFLQYIYLFCSVVQESGVLILRFNLQININLGYKFQKREMIQIEIYTGDPSICTFKAMGFRGRVGAFI